MSRPNATPPEEQDDSVPDGDKWAAGRGARVVLFEKADLAQGTSSASTKLIHGGLRYLEHYEFGLVRESLSEREVLWGIAPHIIRPLRFVLPYREGLRPRWLLRLGLFVYDHLGGRKALPATETVDLTRHPAGTPLKPGFRTGYVYSDGWVDDARLVVLNARDAADRGAQVHTRCEVLSLRRDGEQWRIETERGPFLASAVVNAAGPGVLRVIERAAIAPHHKIRLVRGSHIVVPRLFEHGFAYFFQLPDGRIFFAIPYEDDFTLLGTTDVDHQGSLDKVTASEEEIAYICTGASEYFRKPVTPADVIWAYAGVRPLLDDGSNRPEAATRGYSFALDGGDGAPPLLSVFGGKITTYRHLAQAAVGQLASHLPVLAEKPWTDRAALPGGGFAKEAAAEQAAALARDYPSLGEATARRMFRAYGTQAWAILGTGGLGRDFGHGLSEREVEHLVEREWARTAEDVLWRRTKLGLRFSSVERDVLEQWFAERQNR